MHLNFFIQRQLESTSSYLRLSNDPQVIYNFPELDGLINSKIFNFLNCCEYVVSNTYLIAVKIYYLTEY